MILIDGASCRLNNDFRTFGLCVWVCSMNFCVILLALKSFGRLFGICLFKVSDCRDSPMSSRFSEHELDIPYSSLVDNDGFVILQWKNFSFTPSHYYLQSRRLSLRKYFEKSWRRILEESHESFLPFHWTVSCSGKYC